MTDNTEEFTGSNHLHGEKLRSFLERIQRVRSDKRDLAEDEKAIFAEAKAEGFDTRYMRALLKLMAAKPSEREEHEAMMDVYQRAVGMHRDLPLFKHVEAMGVDVAARESVIEALKQLAPADGEFTVKIGDGPRVRIYRNKAGVQVEEVTDLPSTPKAEGQPSATAAARRAEVPDVTPEEAKQMGRTARQEDEPIVANPFPWDDKRRRQWDEGWREEDGGDGMGPR